MNKLGTIVASIAGIVGLAFLGNQFISSYQGGNTLLSLLEKRGINNNIGFVAQQVTNGAPIKIANGSASVDDKIYAYSDGGTTIKVLYVAGDKSETFTIDLAHPTIAGTLPNGAPLPAGGNHTASNHSHSTTPTTPTTPTKCSDISTSITSNFTFSPAVDPEDTCNIGDIERSDWGVEYVYVNLSNNPNGYNINNDRMWMCINGSCNPTTLTEPFMMKDGSIPVAVAGHDFYEAFGHTINKNGSSAYPNITSIWGNPTTVGLGNTVNKYKIILWANNQGLWLYPADLQKAKVNYSCSTTSGCYIDPNGLYTGMTQCNQACAEKAKKENLCGNGTKDRYEWCDRRAPDPNKPCQSDNNNLICSQSCTCIQASPPPSQGGLKCGALHKTHFYDNEGNCSQLTLTQQSILCKDGSKPTDGPLRNGRRTQLRAWSCNGQKGTIGIDAGYNFACYAECSWCGDNSCDDKRETTTSCPQDCTGVVGGGIGGDRGGSQ